MRWIAPACLALVLVAGCGKDGFASEVARLKGVLDALRVEFADYRAQKEREIEALKAELAEKTEQAGLAARAEGLLKQYEDFKAATQVRMEELQSRLAAQSKKVADLLSRVDELQKLKAGLDAEAESLKAELAKLKKLIGR